VAASDQDHDQERPTAGERKASGRFLFDSGRTRTSA